MHLRTFLLSGTVLNYRMFRQAWLLELSILHFSRRLQEQNIFTSILKEFLILKNGQKIMAKVMFTKMQITSPHRSCIIFTLTLLPFVKPPSILMVSHHFHEIANRMSWYEN